MNVTLSSFHNLAVFYSQERQPSPQEDFENGFEQLEFEPHARDAGIEDIDASLDFEMRWSL